MIVLAPTLNLPPIIPPIEPNSNRAIAAINDLATGWIFDCIFTHNYLLIKRINITPDTVKSPPKGASFEVRSVDRGKRMAECLK